MAAYYNEFDPYAAQWLRNLIAAGHIAAGDVDERPIQEVKADDVKGYTQCHFFAGIGGWSYALRLAGWDDTRPVWTGSCPCQPFSSAGRQKGKADERHLWPEWFRLIREFRPATVFGEQVESAIAHGWLDYVYDDLEGQGYAVGAAVLPACAVGKPHQRKRLWFVANSNSKCPTRGDRCDTFGREGDNGKQSISQIRPPNANEIDGLFSGSSVMGNTEHDGQPAAEKSGSEGTAILNHAQGQNSASESQGADIAGYVADSECVGQSRQGGAIQPLSAEENSFGQANRADADCEWIECPDGKTRAVKSGLCIVANGVSARVGKLRAYGNAIVPQVAAEFIKATM